jgi:hypothetical protein
MGTSCFPANIDRGTGSVYIRGISTVEQRGRIAHVTPIKSSYFLDSFIDKQCIESQEQTLSRTHHMHEKKMKNKNTDVV